MHTTSCWHSRARALASLATCIMIVACADRVAGPEAVDGSTEVSLRRSAGRVECDAGNGGITLPPGFCAVVVADQVGRARHLGVTQSAGSPPTAITSARTCSSTIATTCT